VLERMITPRSRCITCAMLFFDNRAFPGAAKWRASVDATLAS